MIPIGGTNLAGGTGTARAQIRLSRKLPARISTLTPGHLIGRLGRALFPYLACYGHQQMAGTKGLSSRTRRKPNGDKQFGDYIASTLHNTLIFIVLFSGAISALSLSGKKTNYNEAYFEHTEIEYRLTRLHLKEPIDWNKGIGGVLYTGTGRLFSVNLPQGISNSISPLIDPSTICVQRIAAREVRTSQPLKSLDNNRLLKSSDIKEIQETIDDILKTTLSPFEVPKKVLELRTAMDILDGLSSTYFDIDRSRQLETAHGKVDWPRNDEKNSDALVHPCTTPDKSAKVSFNNEGALLYDGKLPTTLTLWYNKRYSDKDDRIFWIDTDYLSLESEANQGLGETKSKYFRIPIHDISSGGEWLSTPPDWTSWLDATAQFQYLSIADAGRILQERAQNEVDQLYNIQGIPVPTKLVSVMGLGIIALALVWFLIHFRLMAELAPIARNSLPINKVLQSPIYGRLVFGSVLVMPVIASLICLRSSCVNFTVSANCLVVAALTFVILFLAVVIGWHGFQLGSKLPD